tara:strand:- start:17292 stop:17633 length:342 start_codon:yes stop_codon:yes gene_type:complete
MRYCFDLDGTLCTLEVDGMTEGIKKDVLQYNDAKPIQDRIDFVNQLHKEGHYIIIETARGRVSGYDWFAETEKQLSGWGLSYDELRTGTKQAADLYIDDKGINADVFFEQVLD